MGMLFLPRKITALSKKRTSKSSISNKDRLDANPGVSAALPCAAHLSTVRFLVLYLNKMRDILFETSRPMVEAADVVADA